MLTFIVSTLAMAIAIGYTGFKVYWIQTHEKNWGTYNLPYLHGSKNLNSFLFEGSYKFGKDSLKEFYLTAAIGLDNGTQIGKNKGFQLKLSKIF